MPTLVLAFLLASIVGGIIKISVAIDFPTPLAISLLWAGYQIIPPFLVSLHLSVYRLPSHKVTDGAKPFHAINFFPFT